MIIKYWNQNSIKSNKLKKLINENKKKMLVSVSFEPTISRLLDGRFNQLSCPDFHEGIME